MTDLFALIFGGTVLGALGSAVAYLFAQLNTLGREGREREQSCQAQLNLSRRRTLLLQNKLIETAIAAGVSVNGPFETSLRELDREERDVIAEEGKP